jgi:hypothetical protein
MFLNLRNGPWRSKNFPSFFFHLDLFLCFYERQLNLNSSDLILKFKKKRKSFNPESQKSQFSKAVNHRRAKGKNHIENSTVIAKDASRK